MTSGQNAMDAEIMDCSGFFDQIDDFLDVPNDDVDEAMEAESLPPIDLDLFPPAAPYPCSDSVFCNLDISAELSVPYEDIVQLEWLSGFFEDSFSCGGGGGLTIDEPPSGSPGKELSNHRFRTSSPVSVLDSSSSSISSCSAEKTSAVAAAAAAATSRCGRARSKRPRPKTVNFRPITVPLLPPRVVACAGSENSDESRLAITIPKERTPEHNKKKKNKNIKFTIPAATPADGDHAPPSQPIRKCLHCEITKTPQWRAGPMGPKTLCNACGVRYKSGRLFPEYRPAASPTFVPTVHSNSHKKVLQMRNKVDGRVTNGPIELIPNAGIAIDYV